MKIKISKNEFNKILDIANSVVSENETISPMLSFLSLDADMDTNTLTCYFQNQTLTVKYQTTKNIQIEKSGKALLKVKILKGIVSKLMNLDILIEKIDNSIKIQCGSFEAFANCLNTESSISTYNDFDEINGINFDMNSNLIHEIQKKLNHCLLTKDQITNNDYNILNGILFDNESEENKINLVATDSFKVSLLKKPLDANKFKIVINQEFLLLINQYTENNEHIRFSIIENNTKIVARWNNITCLCKLLTGTYPNIYNAFSINDGETSEFAVNAKEFYNMIEHGMYLTTSSNIPAAYITVKNSILQVEYHSYDIGNSIEKINVIDFRGKDIDFMVNAKYMNAILKAFDGHDIRVHFSSSNKPIIFADVNDRDFLQLVLPLRSH